MTSLVPSDSLRSELGDAISQYQSNLLAPEGKEVLEYLTEERHLSREAVDHFKLGYTGDSPRLGDPAKRISIPYLSWSGPTQIRFRSLDPNPGMYKYLGSKGHGTRLYNTIALRSDSQRVYVTEGEIDCITAWMAGLPCVAVPGAENWKKSYWRLFRYREVVVLADSGEAGKKLAVAISSDVEMAKIVTMPDDDVNDFYCRYGRDALREFVGADN
ncbi:toprim domain-containing protein [Micromonospora sp. CB01531]|uniref:toprim domain-containing protein n=1 Tax=Micromonospora sp. CB01531 TaxID=1718947 RepID=UPI000ACB66D6|nr:toprim domain-containing protein [Micromonospora sp. CB01531]